MASSACVSPASGSKRLPLAFFPRSSAPKGSSPRRDKITDAIQRQIIVEAPLTLDDHQAILEALRRNCPSALNRVRQPVEDEQRYVRRVTGG